MGTSNISSIGKIFAQGQAADVNGAVSKEEIAIAFTDVMSQMATLPGNDLLSGNELADAGRSQVATGSAADREYDRYQYRDRNIAEKPQTNWKESDQVSEKLDDFADGVKEVLKEELGVSEEQIQEAMETLGLAFVDLMNPKQLAALVAELTGAEDASALLLSSEFMTIMRNVGELSEDLLQELGVSAEELTQLLELSQNTGAVELPQSEDVVELPQNEGTVELSQDKEAVETAQNTEPAETLQNPVDTQTSEQTVADEPEKVIDSSNVQKETTDTAAKETETTPLEEETAESQNGRTAALTRNRKETGEDALETQPSEPEEADGAQMKLSETAGQKHAASDGGQSSANQHTGNAGSALIGQGVTEAAQIQAAENTEGFSAQLDVSNIIRQIAEFSKVTLSSTATTMEMQLNPEHLGKIYLEITSKEGIVSARITAQNEAVKEALESQIVELKQNMNQAGVKVEAVEVTVGSHEFEKNLEQNAKQEERQAEEQEKAAKQTRHINLNELDDLAGIMTEEESLVAQMMADQGNSIDFTA